ncbi:hypothetical protein [Henriciella algicola]|uniref:Vitamin K epoxide reductase domain-containing protein n=1 Tax=Henriciella algicola TaxID=1608422 RepID=A0A399RD40_9PROT|nr:hypothetical protein [Henriciella algicola]RIJ29486.1 hypothetical protein D1222_08780 [Henriciella algicola]
MKREKVWSWLFVGSGIVASLYLNIRSAVRTSAAEKLGCEAANAPDCDVPSLLHFILAPTLMNVFSLVGSIVSGLVLCALLFAFVQRLREAE